MRKFFIIITLFAIVMSTSSCAGMGSCATYNWNAKVDGAGHGTMKNKYKYKRMNFREKLEYWATHPISQW